MLYVAGARHVHMALVGAAAVPVIVLAVTGASYRLRRVFAFLDPWADPRGADFQIIQSYLALGGGGLAGRGLGESSRSSSTCPSLHRLHLRDRRRGAGVRGRGLPRRPVRPAARRGIRIGLRVTEPFGALVAIGVTAMLATQALVNLGVVVGLLPTKGLPLPFVSFGGSSLLVGTASVGLLLSISQHASLSPIGGEGQGEGAGRRRLAPLTPSRVRERARGAAVTSTGRMLKRYQQVHFVGIGGAGMSGIAEVLLTVGYRVTGSDARRGEAVERLERIGAKVFVGHAASQIEGAQVVVYSSAVARDNPGSSGAPARDPGDPGAEMLAELMRVKYGIAIAGTHGKTTTTSMVGAVLAEGGFDPTVVVGGRIAALGANAGWARASSWWRRPTSRTAPSSS